MKISIVMVTWAPDEYRMIRLRKTMKSLEKATTLPYELIVVDNGPKQQTEFLKTQKIDKHIVNEKNEGIGFGRNQGIAIAEGEYIALIDNDLNFRKGWLSKAVDLLERHPNEKLIVAMIKTRFHHKRKFFLKGMLEDYSVYSRSAPGCWVTRKKTFEEVGEWGTHGFPGTVYCDRLERVGYLHVLIPMVKHMGRFQSYKPYEERLRNGKWVKIGD